MVFCCILYLVRENLFAFRRHNWLCSSETKEFNLDYAYVLHLVEILGVVVGVNAI